MGKPSDGKDTGLAWLAVVGAVLTNVMYAAMTRAFGVLYVILLERYGGSELMTSWVGALNLITVGLAGLLSAWLCRRYSFRLVGVVGAVIVIAGFIGTAYSSSLILVLIWYGGVLGVGMSMLFVASFLVLDKNFERYKATAMALAMCGNGLGAFLFSPLLQTVYDHWGYEVSMLSLAGCSTMLLLTWVLYRRPGEPLCIECNNMKAQYMHSAESRRLVSTKYEFEIPNQEEDPSDDTEQTFWSWNLLTNPGVLVLLLQNCTVQCMISFSGQYTPAFAIDRDVDPLKASFLLSIGGLTSIFVPLIISFVMDLAYFRPYLAYMANGCEILGALVQIVTPLAFRYEVLMFLVGLKSGFMGMLLTQRATLANELAGPDLVESVLGMSFLAEAVGSLIGRTVGGALKDAYGVYDDGFYATGAFCLTGGIIFHLVVYWIRRRVVPEEKRSEMSDWHDTLY